MVMCVCLLLTRQLTHGLRYCVHHTDIITRSISVCFLSEDVCTGAARETTEETTHARLLHTFSPHMLLPCTNVHLPSKKSRDLRRPFVLEPSPVSLFPSFLSCSHPSLLPPTGPAAGLLLFSRSSLFTAVVKPPPS